MIKENNVVYAIEIDEEFVLIRDQSLGSMIFNDNLDLKDVANRFMITVDDVKEILLS